MFGWLAAALLLGCQATTAARPDNTGATAGYLVRRPDWMDRAETRDLVRQRQQQLRHNQQFRQQIRAVIRQKQEVEREGAVGERRSELGRPVQQDRREALQALFDIAGLDYDHYSQSK